jgi:hypothetical protein
MLPVSDCAVGSPDKLSKKSDGCIDKRHKIGSRREQNRIKARNLFERKQTAPDQVDQATRRGRRTAISEEIRFGGSEICEVVMNINDDFPMLR